MAAMKGGGYIVGKPKKTRQGEGSTPNCPRPLVMEQRKGIEDKVNR